METWEDSSLICRPQKSLKHFNATSCSELPSLLLVTARDETAHWVPCSLSEGHKLGEYRELAYSKVVNEPKLIFIYNKSHFSPQLLNTFFSYILWIFFQIVNFYSNILLWKISNTYGKVGGVCTINTYISSSELFIVNCFSSFLFSFFMMKDHIFCAQGQYLLMF